LNALTAGPSGQFQTAVTYFSDAERAALALTEAVTRLADRPDTVPGEVWEEAARHYSEKQLAALSGRNGQGNAASASSCRFVENLCDGG
jgi:hypothetical protein